MKKWLKITVTVLEIIFALLAVWSTAMLISGIIALGSVEYNEFEGALGYYLEIGFIQLYCIACSIRIFCSVLMVLCLHIFIRNSSAATPARSLLSKVCLGTAAGANLFFYTAFHLLFSVKYGIAVPFRVCVILWVICVIICITLLIAIAVINAKNKRMLKAAAIQGEPAADGPDQQLS